MPTFLSDPSPAFTFVLLLVAVVAVGVWYRFRDKTSRNRMIAVVLVVGFLLAIGWVVESPRDIAVKRTKAAAEAANKRDWATAFGTFSDTFQYAGRNKASFQKTVADTATQYQADVNVKDFDRASADYLEADRVRIGFIAQVSVPSGGPFPYYVELTYKKESDGQYRIIELELYNFAKRKQGPPEKIPGF